MNNAVITLKTDSVLKSKAMKIADELGFSLSSLINAYLKNLVRRKTVDFSLEEFESHPSKFMINGLKESAADKKAGRIVSFLTGKEEIDYLDKLIKKDEDKLRQKVSKTTRKGAVKYKAPVSKQAGFVSP